MSSIPFSSLMACLSCLVQLSFTILLGKCSISDITNWTNICMLGKAGRFRNLVDLGNKLGGNLPLSSICCSSSSCRDLSISCYSVMETSPVRSSPWKIFLKASFRANRYTSFTPVNKSNLHAGVKRNHYPKIDTWAEVRFLVDKLITCKELVSPPPLGPFLALRLFTGRVYDVNLFLDCRLVEWDALHSALVDTLDEMDSDLSLRCVLLQAPAPFVNPIRLVILTIPLELFRLQFHSMFPPCFHLFLQFTFERDHLHRMFSISSISLPMNSRVCIFKSIINWMSEHEEHISSHRLKNISLSIPYDGNSWICNP